MKFSYVFKYDKIFSQMRDCHKQVMCMEQLLDENACPFDMRKLQLLSDQSSEYVVYRYFDLVLKVYKKDYPFSHLSLKELNAFRKIATQRILFPTGGLWNSNGELAGYQMPLITGERNVRRDDVSEFLKELEVLRQDLELICSHSVILRDINLDNTIYNGQLYLIDPGNYLIGELKTVLPYLDTGSVTCEEQQRLLKEWNYNKVNTLIEMLLFSDENLMDFFQYRQVIQFMMRARKENGFIYNLDVLQKFFHQDSSVQEAISGFIQQYIKDDPKERELFLSLYH